MTEGSDRGKIFFLFRNNFDLLLLVVVILLIMVRWILVFNEEAKAPPIISGNTLLTADNNPDPVTQEGGQTLTDFKNTGAVGPTGYSPSGLGQPCTLISSEYMSPNLPTTQTVQKCDEDSGLVCVGGIYQGTICLKYVNQSCNMRSDCSPLAPLCINKICQREGEVINKPCTSDIDCKGGVNNFNHVCDPVSKLCVYDIWPNDSGCTDSKQCAYDSSNPGRVSCLNSNGASPYVISFNGVYSGTSIKIDGG